MPAHGTILTAGPDEKRENRISSGVNAVNTVGTNVCVVKNDPHEKSPQTSPHFMWAF
jgi:hypothetical protein